MLASSTNLALLWQGQENTAVVQLEPIPFFDLRRSDPAAHALARMEHMRAFVSSCIGPQTPVVRLGLAGADVLAGRWLKASGTPYWGELAQISKGTRANGVNLLNASYEWGCTALAAPAPDGATARLLRTLDWPFHGLGRSVKLWLQSGPAGEFANLSWPGAVGLVTGMAPRRFAACINQPPLKRRAPEDLQYFDVVCATYVAWRSSDRLPALHLLRYVFEAARNYAEARSMLERTPIATPAIFTLVGLTPEQTCVVERDTEAFHTQEGVVSAANVWRYGQFEGEWYGGRTSEAGEDSNERSTMIEHWAGRASAPFEWVRQPILNAMTRLAVEADPAKGTLQAIGYEQAPGGENLALPATLPLTWSANSVG